MEGHAQFQMLASDASANGRDVMFHSGDEITEEHQTSP